MKCPKCHTEVERGSLYCPNCLTEIPWVKEFDSVETLMEKQKQSEPQKPPKNSLRFVKNQLYRHRTAVLLLAAAVTVFFGALFYRQLHTFPALYNRANRAYAEKNYEKSMKNIEAALDKNPGNLSANLLYAELLKVEEDYPAAILVAGSMVKQYPESADAAILLVQLWYHEDRTGEIQSFLKNNTNPKVLEACREYICKPPVSGLPPGTYTSVQTLELKADYDRIYYTLDGTMPNLNSTLYTRPISIGEGTTELNAFGVNSRGITSDIISRKYVIVLNAPEPPVITPEDGVYRTDTKIEIKVPDGCRAYYAFDAEPTVNSTEYTRPVSLPVGSHSFRAILVAANGKISKVSRREYYLEY